MPGVRSDDRILNVRFTVMCAHYLFNPDRVTGSADELGNDANVPVVLGDSTWGMDAGRKPQYGVVLLQVKDGNFTKVQ